MEIIEIDKQSFEYQPEAKKITGVDIIYHYYRIVLNDSIDFYIGTTAKKERFLIESFDTEHLLCIDNRIIVVSNEGKFLLLLKVFEEIYILRKKNGNIYLFSERIAYSFSKAYSINNLSWFSDLLEDIKETENGFSVICIDGSTYEI